MTATLEAPALVKVPAEEAPARDELDFDARYSVAGHRGIAFYLVGYATEWTAESWTQCCIAPLSDTDHECDEYCYVYDEPEEVEDRTRVLAVMVGDDREHVVDVEDLTEIAEEDYCPGCGQIGCGAYG